jgi:hypothetical protein
MTATTFKVLHIDRPQSPRGARVFANLWQFVATRLAPRAAAPRNREQEAAEVREMAFRIQFSDPGFASDLFAAADRHERTA